MYLLKAIYRINSRVIYLLIISILMTACSGLSEPLVSPHAESASPTLDRPSLTVTRNGNKYNLIANQQLKSTILAHFARVAAIEILNPEKLETLFDQKKHSFQLIEVGIHKALSRLLDGFDYSLEWRKSPYVDKASTYRLRIGSQHWPEMEQEKLPDPALPQHHLGQLRAIDKLENLSPTQALVQLTLIAHSESTQLRLKTIESLKAIRLPQASQLLADLTHDKSWQVRQQALLALGQSDEPKYLNLITMALQDSHNKVQFAAIQALAVKGSAESVEPLAALLHAQDAMVRKQVVFALAEIEDPKVVLHLMTASVDPNKSVSAAADAALQLIKQN